MSLLSAVNVSWTWILDTWNLQIHGLSRLSTQCQVVASKATAWSQLANTFDYFVHVYYCGPLFLYFSVCLLSLSNHAFYVAFTLSCNSIHCDDSACHQCVFVCVYDWEHAIHAHFYLHKSTSHPLPLSHLYCWQLDFLVFHISFPKLDQHCLLKKKRKGTWGAVVLIEEHGAFEVPIFLSLKYWHGCKLSTARK